MNKVYSVGSDIESFLMASGLTLSELAEGAYISRPTLAAVIKKNEASPSVLERIYSFIFRKGFRLNRAKCELMQENIVPPDILLFHGAKETLCEVSPQGSREDCDFGKGFYLASATPLPKCIGSVTCTAIFASPARYLRVCCTSG